MILGSSFLITQLGLGPPLSSSGNQNHPDVDMMTITLGILEQQQSPRRVGQRMWVAAELGVEDKVCESVEGMAPGNLRERGGGTSPLRVSGLKGRGGSGEEGTLLRAG